MHVKALTHCRHSINATPSPPQSRMERREGDRKQVLGGKRVGRYSQGEEP